MIIPCVRCGKGIDKPHAGNAKYITNSTDPRTFGIDKVEKFFCGNIFFPKGHNMNRSAAFDTFDEVVEERRIRSEWIKQQGIPEADKEKHLAADEIIKGFVDVTRAKTAIVCESCVLPGDTIIW